MFVWKEMAEQIPDCSGIPFCFFGYATVKGYASARNGNYGITIEIHLKTINKDAGVKSMNGKLMTKAKS
ncbi:hypothetical protein L1887_27604 [Cichorium endivia]|nr:hypothetical protein L1887_27604 [Cichorium endivia]